MEVRAVVAQESGHVEARPAGGFQGNRFAGGLPGAGYVGNKGKARFVVIGQVPVPGLRQVPQARQLRVGAGEGFGVALVLE